MVTLIGGEKGGVGKSTLTVNLASYHREATGSDNLLIVDTDVQGSAAEWNHKRHNEGLEGIECIQLFGKNIISEVKRKTKRYDHIFIDAGGRDSKELRSGMVVADTMVSPIRASQFDVSTLDKLDGLVEEVTQTITPDLKCFVVVNGLKNHPNMPEFGQVMEALKDFDNLHPIPFPIYDRIIFARSAKAGRGVAEMKSKNGHIEDEKALQEIQQLHQILYGQQKRQRR